MSLLDTYLKELEMDTTLNDFNLKEMQLKLPALKHKWIGRFIRHKREYGQLLKEKEKLSRNLIEQTIKNSPVDLKGSAATVSRMVENTDTIKQLNEKIDDIKLVLELLEKTEKVMSNMTFDCRNIIETIKLETS